MGVAGVDQLGPLRAIFADVYGAVRPSRIAVLGCATGNGLDVVDPTVTRHLVGVDLNAATRAGLTLRSERNVPLARAKSFWAAVFERP